MQRRLNIDKNRLIISRALYLVFRLLYSSALRLPWFNSTMTNGKFKEGHNVRMAKKTCKQPIFTKNYGIITTSVSFAHIAAIFRVGFETETETLKNVFPDMSRDSLFTSEVCNCACLQHL